MNEMIYKEEWLEIIKAQEQKLRFSLFSCEDALYIGNQIVRLANEKYNGAVVVSIIEDDMLVFYHKMQGATMENDIWIYKKRNVSKETGVSSLRAYAEIKSGIREPTWRGREESFVACGGCYPVRIADQKPFIYIAVSGLAHYLDHQVIVDAVARRLNTAVGEVGL